VWKDLDLTQLRRLHFTGGEPLLNKDNKKILQHLDKLGVLSNVVLSYNTNGTVLPDTEVLELWQRCRFVRLFFSLDGVGSTFEYTRFPAKWSDVEQNIQYFRSLNRICILIEVNPVIGVHNIFNLPEIFQWWEEHCQTGSQGDPSQIILRYIEPSSFGGQVLSLKHLTNFQANAALDMLQLLTRYTGVQDLINYIKQNRSPDNCWMDYLNKLDSIRNTDWHTALQIQKEATC
jgi:molybdenum cofactor biosynthesis enzyme MoaA